MSELRPYGTLAYRPSPVSETRPDLLDWPWLTAQPPPGALNTVQAMFDLGYSWPRTDYFGEVNGLGPQGYPQRSVPQGTAGTPGGTGGSWVIQDQAGSAVRTSAERLRQWLLAIRLSNRAFPTVGGS